MKKSKRILAGFLSVLITSTMVPMTAISSSAVSGAPAAGSDDVVLRDTQGAKETPADVMASENKISSMQDYYDYANDDPYKNAVAPDADTLPSKVDNSTNANKKYLPPVGDQGQIGSCVLWATVYYQLTYTLNKARGTAVTASTTYAPNYVYNLLNDAEDRGTWARVSYGILQKQGAPSIVDVPTVDTPYPATNYLDWHATGSVWENATNNRIEGFSYISTVSGSTPVTNPKAEQLNAVKSALNNGEILAFVSGISNWKCKNIKSSTSASNPNGYTVDNSFVGESVVYLEDGSNGGHEMTIVGYNDEIWTDINNNNVVDPGEMGAFKILNSWGSGGWNVRDRTGKIYHINDNSGFVWIAYDALNRVSAVSGASSSTSRSSIFAEISSMKVSGKKSDSSKIFLNYTLNTKNRNENRITVKAKDNSGTVVKQFAVTPYNQTSGIVRYGELSYNGEAKYGDGTMALDLNNIVPGITSETLANYKWSVVVSDSKADGNKLTVKDIKIVDRNANKEYKASVTTPVSLDGKSEEYDIPLGSTPVPTNSTTIYYKGYANPNIHYRAGTGAWTDVPGKKMTATNEVAGYTHKYTIDLGTASYAEVCFNDGNNNWDSRNGSNYKFNKGTYGYSNGNIVEIVSKELSGTVSLSASKAPLNQNVTVTANATGGTAPYQYRISLNGNGSETVLKDYSSSNTATFKMSVQGTYSVDVRIKDATGKIITKSASVQAAYVFISGISVSNNNAKAGETVNINASVTGGAGVPLKYQYVIEGNGTTTTLTTKSDNTADWKPAKEGSYVIKVSILFNGNSVSNTQMSYTVLKPDPVPTNSVTIYYKGYSTPYIHYRAGTGSWTAVPGKKMTATTEMSGFTHKYTIELDSASYAEVCFNDGNNNWDSQNGANYKFNKGSWTYANGVINPVQNLALSATVSVTPRYVPLGQTVSGVATASGGTAPYQYRYTYIKNGVETNVLNYNYATSAMYRTSELGDYTMKVYVKDAKGTVATATAPYSVVDYQVSDIKADKSKVKAGETVKFTATVTNNKVPATYTFSATGNGSTQTFSNNSSLTASWTPSKEGTYTIKVVANYDNVPLSVKTISYTVEKGEVIVGNRLTIYYKGYSTPNIHYQVGNGQWTAVPGVKMTATSEMNGFTHKHTIDLGTASYANVCFNDGKGNWDSRNGSNYRFEKGTYTFVGGNISKISNSGSDGNATIFISTALMNLSTLSSDKITAGKSVTVKCDAAGGAGSYKYAVYYKKSGSSKWTTAQSFSENAKVTIKPAKEVKYDVCVKVKDKNGDVSRLYFDLDVTSKLTNTSKISQTTITKGDKVKLTFGAVGGSGGYTYAVFYKQSSNTSWTKKQDYTANKSVYVKPKYAAPYDVCVRAKDSNGKVSKVYYTVDVKEPIENTSEITSNTVKKGQKVTVCCSANGYTAPYTYQVLYKKAADSKWTVVQGYSSKDTVSITFNSAVDYDVCVKAKDSNGTVAKKFFEVYVKA